MTDPSPEPTLEQEAAAAEESAPVAPAPEASRLRSDEEVAAVVNTEAPPMVETSPAPAATPDPHADWGIPLPAEIPRSTYLPAVMAFGITFFLWGFVSSAVVLGIGLLVTVVALVGWIGEMRHGA